MSPEFDKNLLDLFKPKGFYPYEYISDFKYNKEYKYILKVWNKFEMKAMKDYYDLYLKCHVSLLKFLKNVKTVV